MAVLSLRCHVGFSLVVASEGSSLVAVCGFLTAVGSLGAEHGLQGIQASAERLPGSGAQASLLQGMWDLPDPVTHGSNTCPLHWPADSLPLSHQGSPKVDF